MSKFIIDIATPKQAMFFPPIGKALEERGHEVFYIIRKQFEIDAVININGINQHPNRYWCGSHTTGNKYQKFLFGLNRMHNMLPLFENENFDALITLCNPESTQVAYRTGTKIFCFCDIPEATHACKLTLPFADTIFVPFFVNDWDIRQYVSDKVPIGVYEAFDQCLYMPKQVNSKALHDYGLNEKDIQKYVVFRQGEMKASYYNNPVDIPTELYNNFSLMKKIYFPHYDKHVKGDLQSLVALSKAFVGGGGTMNIESIWWNVPTLSTRPMLTCYDQWLLSNGLMHHSLDVSEANEILNAMIYDDKGIYVPDGSLIRDMKFPLNEIIENMEDVIK